MKRATTRGRIGVAVLVTAAVLGFGAVTASPAAAAAEVVVSGPAAGAVVSSPTPVTGSAASPSGVVSVGVAALRPSDNLWLQPTGGFAPVEAFWPAALASPGQATTHVVGDPAAAPGRGRGGGPGRGRRRHQRRRGHELPGGHPPDAHPPAGSGHARAVVAVPADPGAAHDLRRRRRAAGTRAVRRRRRGARPHRRRGGAVRERQPLPELDRLRAAARRVRLVVREQRPAPARPPAAQPERADRRVVRLARRRSPHGATTAPGACSDRTPTRSPTPSRPTCSTGASPSPACTPVASPSSSASPRRTTSGCGWPVAAPGAGYDPPAEVLARLDTLGDGDWLSLGSYKFVVGQRAGPGRQQWDCTSPDPGPPLDHRRRGLLLDRLPRHPRRAGAAAARGRRSGHGRRALGTGAQRAGGAVHGAGDRLDERPHPRRVVLGLRERRLLAGGQRHVCRHGPGRRGRSATARRATRPSAFPSRRCRAAPSSSGCACATPSVGLVRRPAGSP